MPEIIILAHLINLLIDIKSLRVISLAVCNQCVASMTVLQCGCMTFTRKTSDKRIYKSPCQFGCRFILQAAT